MNGFKQHGLSLIELMVAMTLGLMLLAGLAVVFANSSQSQRELQRSAQQIENGRYAMDAVTQDIHLAGYYGRYSAYPDVNALPAFPDPCITGNAAALATALAFPVQGYVAANQTSTPDLSATTCGAAALLPAANLHPGSDILVIRRAATTPLAIGANAALNEVYLQSSPASVAIQYGANRPITSASQADGITAATIVQKNGIAESIRKYHVHIYFVAPCSVPAGTSPTCTGAAGEDTIPTLKRLELGVDGSNNPAFNVVPIAEGIEAFKLEYGIDNSPNAANGSTGRIGDGAPDLYIPNIATAAPAAADFAGAVSTKVWLIARNTEPSPGFTDTKTYPVATSSTVLGAGTVQGTGLVYGPYNDQFKRHSYFSGIRLTNLSARRENP
jgi:type IV pilus assembly protein PilW